MIRLREDTIPKYRADFPDDPPGITPYPVKSRRTTSAMIVCPGGNYTERVAHESEPIALWLSGMGISAFLLSYRVHPYTPDISLLERAAGRAFHSLQCRSIRH